MVNDITYMASQPWSFPSSMILGFTAETKSKEFTIDNKEIKEARWFSVDEINQMVQNKKLVISKKDSILNYIIELWIKRNS
jgi:NAD+ diphosphatase